MSCSSSGTSCEGFWSSKVVKASLAKLNAQRHFSGNLLIVYFLAISQLKRISSASRLYEYYMLPKNTLIKN